MFKLAQQLDLAIAEAKQRFEAEMAALHTQNETDTAVIQQRFDYDMAVVETLPRDSTGTGFLSLSPELRNEIYKLALTTPQPIFVAGDGTASDRFTYCTWRHLQGCGLTPCLLATCKRIHSEATPIFYGSNSFNVSTISSKNSRIWLETLGSSVAHLRTVTMDTASCHRKEIRRALECLGRAEMLELLVIGRGCWENFRTPRTMAAALLPFMMQTHGKRKGAIRTGKVGVLVLTFTKWEVRVDASPEERNSHARYARKIREVKKILRAKLAKIYELEEDDE